MSLTRLNTVLARTEKKSTITQRDVAALRAAVRDGGLDEGERAALQAFRQRLGDRFDADATMTFEALLGSAPPPPPATTPTAPPAPASAPEVVAWDHFQVAPSRDRLAGDELEEGQDTFARLATAVSAGTLTEKEQLLLASATARVGVLGEAQALRAVSLLEKLPAADAARFRELTKAAGSPLEQAFLFKGLGAGHTVDELGAFAGAIRGWSDEKLIEGLNLADPILEDGVQSGVKQQFFASCVITTGQALRGEVDPLYALEVRTANADVHTVDDADPFKTNQALATEQGTTLDLVGGYATPRAQMGGVGVQWDRIDAVYNQRAAQTGFVYSSVHLDARPDLTTGTMLDLLAKQLAQGIPSPILVGNSWSPKCHAMLALEVSGQGDAQRFLIHDPWSGDTFSVTRKQFVDGAAPMGEFTVIGGMHLASPAPATPVPPLSPPPPTGPEMPA